MWTGAEMKDRAKDILRGSYWRLFWPTLLVTVLGLDYFEVVNPLNMFFRLTGHPLIPVSLDRTFWVNLAVSLLFGYLAVNIFNVGLCRYYLQNHGGQAEPGNLLFGFRNGYPHLVWALFTTDIVILLWSVLLFFPGIVAAYRYRMVPYLLSENPSLSGKEARELSSRMTQGHKADLFVLDLSFLGWFLLGMLIAYIGAFFVLPYYKATYAEAYLFLREEKAAPQEPTQGENPDIPVEP